VKELIDKMLRVEDQARMLLRQAEQEAAQSLADARKVAQDQTEQVLETARDEARKLVDQAEQEARDEKLRRLDERRAAIADAVTVSPEAIEETADTVLRTVLDRP